MVLLAIAVVSVALNLYAFTSPASTTTVPPAESTTFTSTETIVSTVTVQSFPVLSASNASSNGLQLQVAMNSSSIGPHGEVTVRMELFNTLDRNVSLTVPTDDNITTWDESDFFCGENPSYSLVGFAVFSGHFTAENISEAGAPLQVAAPLEVPCPYRLPVSGATFLPESDRTVSSGYNGQTQEASFAVTAEVNATTGYCTTSVSSSETVTSCSTTSGLLGYWSSGAANANAGNLTLASKGFVYFPLGEYTIVVTDDWGQYVYATFDVV